MGVKHFSLTANDKTLGARVAYAWSAHHVFAIIAPFPAGKLTFVISEDGSIVGMGILLSLLDAAEGRRSTAQPLVAVVRRGVLLNLLNPKLTVFFFAFLPQFVDRSAGPFDPRLIGLASVFMAMTLAVFAGYAYASAAVRSLILGAPAVRRWIQRSLGVVLIGFAARLATTDR